MMSEYSYVEKPLLDQLRALGWEVIDQNGSVPTDPAASRRASFREVALREEFRTAVRSLNRLDDGRSWLTERQRDDLFDEVTEHPGKSLLEANEAAFKSLLKITADVNELTGEQDAEVRLVDFADPTRNRFLAISQFRIDTSGQVKPFIIPDIVLFVNGLPLVVIEAKDANLFMANPMHEAFEQLMPYTAVASIIPAG